MAVSLVYVLDDLFALIAGGEIEVDVGPLATVFVEESLEEQLHADGIDGGDFEGVADGGVGSRTAALGEDAVALAVADEIPNDEEVAGEAKFGDELEFVLDLGAGFGKEVVFGR